MLRPHEKKRLLVGLVLTVTFWVLSSFFSAGYGFLKPPTDSSVVRYALYVILVFLAGYSGVFFFWIFPVFFVVALMKLRDQKRIELDELGDDNKVRADPEGERKLHEYLTALTSLEARIGLLQRSDPWRGDEPHREKPKGPVWRFSRSTLSTVRLCMILGFVAGVSLAAANLAWPNTTEISTVLKRTMLMRGVVSGLLGAAFAAPLGWIVALLFGKTEPIEQPGEQHDAGGSGPETA